MRTILICLLAAALIAGCGDGTYRLASPDSRLEVGLLLTDSGEPHYFIEKDGEKVLQTSTLGVVMDYADFTRGLKLVSASEPTTVTDNYEILTGKRRHINYSANEQIFSLITNQEQTLDIVFRVSNDGVAFRYVFTGDTKDVKKLKKEVTSFAFGKAAQAWLQPMAVAQTGFANTNPSYEEHYQMQIPVGTVSPTEAGWVFPALFRAGNNWVLITEAGMDGNYHGSRLQQHSPNSEYTIGTPMAPEIFPGGALLAESTLPFASPWRVIAVGSLAAIVESTLGTDLAEPAINMDMSFIKPGQASWSWALLKDDSIKYDIQKQFIDYAADMQWEYTLIDASWDTTIGYEKIAQLADYANSKDVGLLLWYNSSGSWNTTDLHPKSQLLTHDARVAEFSRIHDMGVKGVKIDFFAGDGKSMMQYYNDILRDAAKFELLVNFHGSTLPRGWQRTYPNLMTMEAVRGFEFVTFSQETADLAPSHSAMLPFARNVFDPMDYTPTTFSRIPGIERKTSNGFELAQTVIFQSGIQHIAETPGGMAQVPDYVKNYMRQLPNSWDDTRFVAGFPGKLAVIARRAGDTWYVAGINGEDSDKSLTLDLSFIDAAFIDGEEGYLITDGNTESGFVKNTIAAKKKTPVIIKGHGGFVMVFENAAEDAL